jgi:fermentation-respiration switch protein FrsA (DUF1100 family)
VKAAFDWLKRQQRGSRVAVLGISLGGAAALLGEGGPIAADALVLQAVYPDIRHAIRNRIRAVAGPIPAVTLEPLLSYQSLLRFGVGPNRLSPLSALPRYSGPVLIIGGGADRYTPPAETRLMFEAARAPKRLWIIAGADHNEASGQTNNAYRERLADFLEVYLPLG